jgi:uncharacterized protein YecA (UPF0149 family)
MKIDKNDIKRLFEDNEDLQRMWHKLHTPLVRSRRKVGRNEVCPFCNSGKKFKDCKCYELYKDMEYVNEK